jgi:adenylate cyclase
MPSLRRLTAILAADVAGYSRLMGADEEGTHERLKDHIGQLVDPKIKEHRGRTVKNTGDGMLVEFPSVVDAVRCAVEVQRGMVERNAATPVSNRIEFRVGINLSDVIVDGEDIFGDGVNIAARLEALAEPSGICVSRMVRDQVRDKLAFAFEDIGEQRVKNIARPVRAYRIPIAETAMEKAPLPLPEKPSIAVLPFQNMSGDPEQEFFADGISEDITTALSKVRWFFVIARNSSFTYKGRAVDVKQFGRELGVRYVLEGSVRKADTRIRITAQLIDATTGNHIWAERYDRELADIFAVQDAITERVVGAIEPELYAAEHFRSQRKPPESLDAWECLIRALSYVRQATRGGNTEAETLCRRAIAIAPCYGQAHSLLAWLLVRRSLWAGGIDTVLPEATAEARTALGLDERDPWAHMTHGQVLLRMRRHQEAERALRRALELNPNFALAHAFLGLPLAHQGAHEEAVKSAEHALRLSPRDPLVGAYASLAMANAHFAVGHYADCVASARDAIERYPEFRPVHHLLVAAEALRGDREAAAEALPALLRLRPDLSLAWLKKNMTFAGEIGERVLEGLRKAGVPEE